MKSLWEILVPRFNNKGKEYPVKYHQAWDEKVRKITKGLTILRTAKGQWISPDRKIFLEEMIPVRIYCTEKDIEKIIQFTIKHYGQQAVLAYEVSSNVKLVYKNPTPA
ncbi:MAG: hypothetical protein ABIB71_06515 [Candidatus Woesearchaeota archaeon]